ncbi:MAG TPA: sensor histidine kinase [Rectinemataceae bacterium]|nr:sensor histidine kinase [Rectinemataceae bacterium]
MQLRTIVASYTLLVLAVTILLWTIHFTAKPRQTALALWAAAYSYLFVATISFALQDLFPRYVYIFTFNSLVHAFFLVLIQGIRALQGRRPRWRGILLIIGVSLVWNFWFTFGQDQMVLRTLQYSLFVCVFSSAFSLVVLKSKVGERGASIILAVLGFVMAGSQVVRIFFILAQGYTVSILSGMPWDTWLQAIALLDVSLIAIGLIYLFATRLNAALAASVEERGILLREMTHRIKNDLALIDSLISLEEGTTQSAATLAHLGALRERIQCITAAHDLFSHHDGRLGKIAFGDYLEVVSRGLPVYPWIGIERSFDEAELSFELAQPAGLLMNELAVNAIKYAFPGGRQGKIHLRFAKQGSRGRLSVADDGIGMTWPSSSPGLGTSIIASMVARLGGELRFECRGGSSFEVDFPLGAS